MRVWELFRQAMIGATRARLRSTLTAAGIAIGCGALVTMVAFALGLQQQIELPFKKLGLLNEIRVSVSRGESPNSAVDESQAAESRRLNEEALEGFRRLPGVKYAYPDLRMTSVGVEYEGRKESVLALAAPREAGFSEEMRSLLVRGEFFSLDDSPQIILSEELVRLLGFRDPTDAIGRTVVVSAAGLSAQKDAGKFEFESKQVEVRVIGVFGTTGFGPFAADRRGGAALIPVDLMQHLPGLVESQLEMMRNSGDASAAGYRQVVVRAESPADVQRIAEAIEEQGFRVRTMVSRLQDARTAFLFLKSLLTLVGSVAMVIAGLGIANTLLMTVLERYEEIGLYKAIGATDGDVRFLFLSEAAVLGLVGGLMGLALAGVVCWGLQWGLTAYLANQGVDREVDAFFFPWWLLGGGLAFSLAVSVVSGLYPASRAARVEPIEALRRG